MPELDRCSKGGGKISFGGGLAMLPLFFPIFALGLEGAASWPPVVAALPKTELFLQKNYKIFERWELCPQTFLSPAVGGSIAPKPAMASGGCTCPYLIANTFLAIF